MKLWNQIILAGIAAALMVSVGCVNLWQKNLDIKTYVVEAQRNLPAMEKPLAGKLKVDSVVVLPPYNVRNLILRENDVEYSTSYYTELLMSPSENFRNAFYIWFSDSGIFSDVEMENRTDMTHRLAVTVMQLHGDEVENKAVLKIKTTLFDEKTKGIRVLFTKDYSQQIAVADTTAEELIRAYDKALVKILADCEQDVIAHLN